MNNFTVNFTPSVMFGDSVENSLCSLPNIKRSTSILIVTDANLLSLGLVNPTIEKLTSLDISVTIFDEVEADPSYQTVMRGVELAKTRKCDLVIGFGGGSSLDVAKLISVLSCSTCTQTLDEMFGVDQIQSLRIPLILIPTTAGTGSEATPISIVTTGETTKAGIVSPVLLSDCAILDPRLTTGIPPNITAATGIDAMVHAIEAYTSKIKKNPVSDVLACKALKLLAKNIRTVVFDGQNVEARGEMLLGSMLAGQAFANSPVGGVHALAYPLGGHFHIPHGLSNALMLPHVMGFNLTHATTHYAELARLICPDETSGTDNPIDANILIRYFSDLIEEVELPNKLRLCGVSVEDIPMLASEAMLQQRLLVNNPRELNEKDANDLYQKAF